MVDLDLDYDLPETWQGKMEALTIGVVDFDDWDQVAGKCAELADKAIEIIHNKAKSQGKTNISPFFSSELDRALDRLLTLSTKPRLGKKQKEQREAVCKWFVHCGTVADAIERGETDFTCS
ncbi:MAG: hypothetical protein WCJ35_03405 [Planctomycetota bacterium]